MVWIVEILTNFVQWNALVSIIIFSFIVTFILTFLYKKLMPKGKMDELKEKQKKLRQELKENKDKPEKLSEIQKEMMQSSMESMKMTFKPMMITFIPLLLIFWGLKKLYMDVANVGNIIAWTSNLPLIGTGAGWLLCYIIFSFAFSLILRKLFKL